VFCIGFSGKKTGSQIILCTDGCANIGVGSLNRDSNTQFYEELADEAKSKGVKIFF
jgi:hypothetical protein